MLKKILFNNQVKSQLIIAVIGSFLGFTFLIISIHYLIRVNEFGEGEEILGSNSLIIQKKISNYNAIKIAKTDFGEKEISNLLSQPFVEHVEPILSNSFEVSFQTDSDLVPYFRTDVFVQSVDSDFLKFDSTKWKWAEGDEFVPIVLPREFLVMLNTFASAKGLPQVSDELAKSISFKFKLYNDKQSEFQKAQIIGFTSEVSAILVPSTFMEYGNNKFPTEVPAKITQLMVSVKEGNFGTFEKFMEARSLESKESSMIVGKLKSIAGTLFGIVMGISIIAVFLASLVLIQYAQLMMTKNAYEIKTLLRIGYTPKSIIAAIINYFIKVFAVITLLSASSFILLKIQIDGIMMKGGIMISSSYTILSFSSVIIAFVIYTLVNYLNAKKEILRAR
mgnify:CR=1 FL=1|jgi:hypothetical protein